MADPIEANYVPDGDDWTITVSGRGRTLSAKAPGIIAARDRTDQLVEELAPGEEHRIVVHLLNGDAIEFTTAYLTARMAKAEPAAAQPEAQRAPAPPKPRPAPSPPSPRPRESMAKVVATAPAPAAEAPQDAHTAGEVLA